MTPLLNDLGRPSGSNFTGGGTITFNLYGPKDRPNCDGEPAYSETVPADHNGSDYATFEHHRGEGRHLELDRRLLRDNNNNPATADMRRRVGNESTDFLKPTIVTTPS